MPDTKYAFQKPRIAHIRRVLASKSESFIEPNKVISECVDEIESLQTRIAFAESAAYERAAKICDAKYESTKNNNYGNDAFVADELGRRIRALIPQPTEPPKQKISPEL